MHLGLIIKELIEKKRLSVAEFAGKVGYSRQHMYDVLEKQYLGTDVLEKISNALEVPIAYFFIHTIEEFELLERIKWPERGSEIAALKKEIENLNQMLKNNELIVQSNEKLIMDNQQMKEDMQKLLSIYERIDKNISSGNG